MTRKDICKLTGLSVKTLRLYEEKGLISPAKEYRNGREYREYSPALVSQLQEIVLLRRALFTMEEIKTMQAHPEQIPVIFQNYQNYLESQTQALHRLRQAADRVESENLSSIHLLADSLRDTAEEMPLPQMDLKPNFKRIDQLDEGPRHVEPQENFDEMVPNPKVVRQLNLLMDRDKANNINIAFGQYNALRDGEFGHEEGPVQRETVHPLWYRIISGILSLGLFVTIVLLVRDRYFTRWVLFFGALALRLIWAGLPLLSEKRKWEQKHGEAPEAARQAEQKHRVKIAALVLAGLLVVGGGITGVCVTLDRKYNSPADLQVFIPSNIGYLSIRDLHAMEEALSPLVDDLDGNGISHVNVTQDYEDYQQTVLEFYIDVRGTLTTSGSHNSYITLPDSVAVPGRTRYADISGTAPLADIGYGELPAWASIFKDAAPEQQEAAIALLERLLAP